MKKWFLNLSISYRAALLSSLLVLVGVLGTIFCYFNKHPDIPNGLIIGGLVGILSYLLMGLVEGHDEKNGKLVLTIIVMVIRFVLIALLIVLTALLWYKAHYNIFNLFSEIIGYSLSLISFITIYLTERRDV